MLICIRKTFLIIAWFHIFFVWENPYLEKLNRLIGVFILFAMLNTGSCTHRLHITLSYHLSIAHAILMFQVTTRRNRNDLHIIMWMCTEAHTAGHRIIIQNS